MTSKLWLTRILAGPSKVIRFILISLLLGIRPLLGPACCKFSVSCTDFAVLKLKEGPLFPALWEIIKRLARCQPFYRSFTKH